MRDLPAQVAVAAGPGSGRPPWAEPARFKTLGIFGYGRIGRVVATYGRTFGMEVLVWSRPESCERARADGHEVASSQADFFEQSDVASFTCAWWTPPAAS